MLSMMFADAIAKREQRSGAVEILSRVGLGARLSHKPQHLRRGSSNGSAIARAQANNPPFGPGR